MTLPKQKDRAPRIATDFAINNASFGIFQHVKARTCYEAESGFQGAGYRILTITLHAKLVKVRKDLPACVISQELLNGWKFVPENSTLHLFTLPKLRILINNIQIY